MDDHDMADQPRELLAEALVHLRAINALLRRLIGKPLGVSGGHSETKRGKTPMPPGGKTE